MLGDARAVRVVRFLLLVGEPCSLRRIALATGMGYRSAAEVVGGLVREGVVAKLYSAGNLGLYVVPEELRGELRCLFSAAPVEEPGG